MPCAWKLRCLQQGRLTALSTATWFEQYQLSESELAAALQHARLSKPLKRCSRKGWQPLYSGSREFSTHPTSCVRCTIVLLLFCTPAGHDCFEAHAGWCIPDMLRASNVMLLLPLAKTLIRSGKKLGKQLWMLSALIITFYRRPSKTQAGISSSSLRIDSEPAACPLT